MKKFHNSNLAELHNTCSMPMQILKLYIVFTEGNYAICSNIKVINKQQKNVLFSIFKVYI